MGDPISGASIVCVKPDIYKKFPFLAQLHDPEYTPREGVCSLLARRGDKVGDGVVFVGGLIGSSAMVTDQGETSKGLTRADVKRYHEEGWRPPNAVPIEPKIATRFIAAMFGPEELSAEARKQYCEPLSHCPHLAK